MKDAVKTLIKSPTAFIMAILIIVLVLLFVVRAVFGIKLDSVNNDTPSSISLVEKSKS